MEGTVGVRALVFLPLARRWVTMGLSPFVMVLVARRHEP